MKSLIYLPLMLASIFATQSAIAGSARGEVTQGKSKIGYVVDTNTQRYTLNLSDAFRLRAQFKKTDLERVRCELEELFIKDANGKMSLQGYSMGRTPVQMTFSISDFDFKELENAIRLDLLQKGHSLANLKRDTKFFIKNLQLDYEWLNTALAQKDKSGLALAIEDLINKAVLGGASDLHEFGKVTFLIPYHVAVCDLLEKNLTVTARARVDVVNDKIGTPFMTKNQLSTLNLSLMAMTNILKKAQERSAHGFDADLRRLIHASAAIAFNLSKLGFTYQDVTENRMETLLNSMFTFHLTEPKRMSNNDLENLTQRFTRDVRSEEKSIPLNKTMNVEVIK